MWTLTGNKIQIDSEHLSNHFCYENKKRDNTQKIKWNAKIYVFMEFCLNAYADDVYFVFIAQTLTSLSLN